MQPIYRIEEFLNAIVNGLPCPLTPIYRIETYLAKLCGADVQIPNPIYRIETYLAKLCGMDVAIPNPIYRTEQYLAAACGMDVEIPTPIYRIETWLYEMASNLDWATFTGSIIQFNTKKAHAVQSAVATITPVQSGSGDPSPDNVRPISGWANAHLYREVDYDAGADPSYTIDLDGTRYGGSVDFVSGVLTVDRAMVDLGTLTWVKGGTNVSEEFRFTANIPTVISTSGGTVPNMVCSHYKAVSPNATYTQTQGVSNNLNIAQAIVFDPTYKTSEAASFKTAMSGVQLVYELATPLTIQLTAQQVEALKGQNTMWADTGDITVVARGEAIQLNGLKLMRTLLGSNYVNNGTAEDISDEEAASILLGGKS